MLQFVKRPALSWITNGSQQLLHKRLAKGGCKQGSCSWTGLERSWIVCLELSKVALSHLAVLEIP